MYIYTYTLAQRETNYGLAYTHNWGITEILRRNITVADWPTLVCTTARGSTATLLGGEPNSTLMPWAPQADSCNCAQSPFPKFRQAFDLKGKRRTVPRVFSNFRGGPTNFANPAETESGRSNTQICKVFTHPTNAAQNGRALLNVSFPSRTPCVKK